MPKEQTIAMMMRNKKMKFVTLMILLLSFSAQFYGQDPIQIYDYRKTNDYIIRDINVVGVKYLNANSIIGVSGLMKGQVLSIYPGGPLTDATQKLWDQGLFSDVKITYTPISADTVDVNIHLQERPRIAELEIVGARADETNDIKEKLNIKIGSQVSSYVLNNTENIIKKFFIEKGFLNTTVSFIQKDNPDFPNSVILTVNIDKKKKVKIEEITFEGNDSFDAKKLRRQMKGTKIVNLNIFKASKYITEKFDEDKQSLISFYNDNGFKDFEIVSDSLYNISEDRVGLRLKLNEGNQYYIRNINWVGNSIYPTDILQLVFDVDKGSVYNRSLIYDRLKGESGAQDAVNNLYLDNGYLFSNITPIESKIEGDSIDLEIRIYEGDQAYLNDIIITGNDRTNEHVARRELYTLPGDLFSKDRIIRSVRELGVLGHWDAEKINPTPITNQISGAVDLQYDLEEKPNDQFEISGGWGAGMIIGTVGVSFNNFAMKNFFKPNEWRPYPSGDGQTLSIRAQSNGKVYQSYSLSFSEPWLGGKKPNSLSISIYKSLLTNGNKRGSDGYASMNIYGASIGFGKRLSWPDDYFSVFGQIGYQKYDMNNYTTYFVFENGVSNLLSITGQIQRYSISPSVIYPRSGSSYTFSLQITPPYSLLSNKDYSIMTDQEKYKWIEFHKWTFKAENYFPITTNDKMVFASKFAFGYLGHFNKDIGPSPFENYSVGGDGMSGYTFYGQDIIKLRGYDTGTVTPHEYTKSGSYVARGNVYSKVTFEVRYPLMLKEQYTIYALAFLEAGRAWSTLKEYNPFKMNRSAGFGLRAYLPMFGMIGFDWGYGFDSSDYIELYDRGNGSQFHFVIGTEF